MKITVDPLATCSGCLSQRWLYADAHGTHCDKCGPSVPMRGIGYDLPPLPMTFKEPTDGQSHKWRQRMTEQEYIDATNLSKIMMAKYVISELILPDDESGAAASILSTLTAMQDNLESIELDQSGG